MRRHRLDPFSLLFGALFVGVGVSFLMGSSIGDAKDSVWPMFAIVVGSTFVVWAVTTVVREWRSSSDPSDRARTTEPADEGRHSNPDR